MTASVEIITELKENILLLKSSAISEKDWKNYVLVDKKWQQSQVEIETWISSDWKTEIISWLKSWDKILLKEFTISSENVEKSKTLFSTPERRRRD